MAAGRYAANFRNTTLLLQIFQPPKTELLSRALMPEREFRQSAGRNSFIPSTNDWPASCIKDRHGPSGYAERACARMFGGVAGGDRRPSQGGGKPGACNHTSAFGMLPGGRARSVPAGN